MTQADMMKGLTISNQNLSHKSKHNLKPNHSANYKPKSNLDSKLKHSSDPESTLVLAHELACFGATIVDTSVPGFAPAP